MEPRLVFNYVPPTPEMENSRTKSVDPPSLTASRTGMPECTGDVCSRTAEVPPVDEVQYGQDSWIQPPVAQVSVQARSSRVEACRVIGYIQSLYSIGYQGQQTG